MAKKPATLQDIFRKISAQPPSEQREKSLAFTAMLIRNQELQKQSDAKQSAKRKAMGLSKKSGTGQPEPCIPILGLPVQSVLDSKIGKKIGGTYDPKAFTKACLEHNKKLAEELPIGVSRVGGLPDLPEGVPWPRIDGKLMPFLAQLNLAEFPPAAHKVLPKDGHLFVFAMFYNGAKKKDVVNVILHRGDGTSLKRAKWPADRDIHPRFDVRIHDVLPATTTPKGRTAAKRSAEPPETLGQLFGEMDDYYGTPGDVAFTLLGDGADWITLLAIESRGSMQWSDSGTLYLLIRRSALKKLDFSQALPAICST